MRMKKKTYHSLKLVVGNHDLLKLDNKKKIMSAWGTTGREILPIVPHPCNDVVSSRSSGPTLVKVPGWLPAFCSAITCSGQTFPVSF